MKILVFLVTICFVSFSQTDTIFLLSDSVSHGKVVDNSEMKKVEIQEIHPLVFDTNEVGSLSVTTDPQNVEVFINGELIGNGNQLLSKMKTGMYRLNLKLGDENKEALVLVQSCNLTSVQYLLGRRTWFVIEPSFNNFFVSGEKTIGPTLDIGIQHNNSYYGIDYSWNFMADSKVEMFGGSAFKYRYSFPFFGILTISPGAMLGFWYAEIQHEDTHYYDYCDEKYFWMGVCTQINLGYRWAFLKFDNEVLFGTAVSDIMKMGITFKL